jgi:hypothetical protein
LNIGCFLVEDSLAVYPKSKEKKMLRDYALKAWEAEKEKRRQSDFKKRKRRAKKIEEEIYDLLPKDSADYDFQRNLDDAQYGVVVSLTEEGQCLNFVFDENDDLAILGECQACQQEALSPAISSAAELGRLIESFETGEAHDCPKKS